MERPTGWHLWGETLALPPPHIPALPSAALIPVPQILLLEIHLQLNQKAQALPGEPSGGYTTLIPVAPSGPENTRAAQAVLWSWLQPPGWGEHGLQEVWVQPRHPPCWKAGGGQGAGVAPGPGCPLPSALCLQVPQGFMWEDTAPSPVWLTDTVCAAQGDPTSGRPFPGRVLRETVVLSRAALPEGGLQDGRGSQTVGWILRAGRGVTAPWDVPGEAGGGSGTGAAPGIRAPTGTRLRAGQPAGSPSPDSLATGHQEGLQQEWRHQPGAGLSGPVDPLLPLPRARSCLLGNGWE